MQAHTTEQDGSTATPPGSTAPTSRSTARPEVAPTAQRHPQESSTRPVTSQQPSTAQTPAATVSPAGAGPQAAPIPQRPAQDSASNNMISGLELRKNIIHDDVFHGVAAACTSEPDFEEKKIALQLQIASNRGGGDCLFLSALQHSVASPTLNQVNNLRRQVSPHHYLCNIFFPFFPHFMPL